MSQEALSLSELVRERDEMVKDRIAFVTAFDLLRKRIMESAELQPARHPLLHEWSGTRNVVGGMEMAIHAIERTIEGYNDFINKIHSGEILNLDRPARPVFGVLSGGKEE